MSVALQEHVNAANEPYLALFRAAVDQLRCEDEALRAAMTEGHDATGGYVGVARGLTYWLFETTLVYFIFRAWVRLAHVAWEHAVGPSSERPDAFTERRRGASEKCDLVLLGDGNRPVAAFEAKWWNTELSGKALLSDVKKLRRNFANIDKFLLTFWWSTDAQKDFRDADDFCQKSGLSLVYCSSFYTSLIDGARGAFTFGVISVPEH